jgi:hypothetical protein
MQRQIIISALGAAMLAGTFPSEAYAISPPLVSAQAIAGPTLTTEARYRRPARVTHRVHHRRRVSRVAPAVAAGAALGLFGALAAAAATPSYSYGYPYPYGYGYGYPYSSA